MSKNLVSIAGYDPSGGAGVLLDIGVFERLGHRGFGVLTAVTAQTPARVSRVYPLAARAVAAQFDRLAEAAEIGGIKVGMVATPENLAATAVILAKNARVPRVVDPVFLSSSGAVLLEKRAWPRFLDAIRGRAGLITPNLDEAEVLTGRPVRSVKAMRSAAVEITRNGRIPCLLKGGHLEGRTVDVLHDGRELTIFEHRRTDREVHGTGCFLSAAILGYLASGLTLKEACGSAIALIEKAIRSAGPAGGGRWVFNLTPGSGRRPSTGRARR